LKIAFVVIVHEEDHCERSEVETAQGALDGVVNGFIAVRRAECIVRKMIDGVATGLGELPDSVGQVAGTDYEYGPGRHYDAVGLSATNR